MTLGELMDNLKRLAKAHGTGADVWIKVDGVEARITQINVNDYLEENTPDVVLEGLPE